MPSQLQLLQEAPWIWEQTVALKAHFPPVGPMLFAGQAMQVRGVLVASH